MENSKNLVGLGAALAQDSMADVVDEIVWVVRDKADTIPNFVKANGGCIQITFAPCAREVATWLNLSTDSLADDDLGEINITRKIYPSGSYVVDFKSEDGIDRVNCRGYAALKTAYQMESDYIASLSEDEQKGLVEENGWAKCDGCAKRMFYFRGIPVLKLCVCVSGAAADEDKLCAEEGLEAASKKFSYIGLTYTS